MNVGCWKMMIDALEDAGVQTLAGLSVWILDPKDSYIDTYRLSVSMYNDGLHITLDLKPAFTTPTAFSTIVDNALTMISTVLATQGLDSINLSFSP